MSLAADKPMPVDNENAEDDTATDAVNKKEKSGY